MATYILKNKDCDVLSFEVSSNEEIQNVEPLNSDFLPFDLNNIKSWILNRRVPNNREFVDEIIETFTELENEKLMDYINTSFALSLNDSFWIVPAENNVSWDSVNLYHNDFNLSLEKVAFCGEHLKLNGIILSPEYTTNGMIKKCWHQKNKQIFLYKGQSQEFANGGKEAFSEYYMAQIAEALGFDFVPYDLEEFYGDVACVCPIFTDENNGYYSIYKVLEQNEDDKEWLYLEKDALLNKIARYYNKEKLADLMVFDALILNIDRHLGNFGMIIDNNNGTLLKPAPIFDNGFSLINFLTKYELNEIPKIAATKIGSLGYDFDTQLKTFIQKRHASALQNLRRFEFKKHPQFNLGDDWLKPIQSFIQKRADFALKILAEK